MGETCEPDVWPAWDGATVQVTAIRCEREIVADAADANWLSAHLDVTVDGFAASLELALLTEDLEHFLAQLLSVLEEAKAFAEFSTVEDVLRLTVHPNKPGRATVSGAVTHLNNRNQLSFTFQTDRTFLELTAADLRSVNTVFPTRGN